MLEGTAQGHVRLMCSSDIGIETRVRKEQVARRIGLAEFVDMITAGIIFLDIGITGRLVDGIDDVLSCTEK